jgi:hypothetical protein
MRRKGLSLLQSWPFPGRAAGFQFAVTLQQGFRDLPSALKLIHLISLSLIAISTILLLSPAPYHRIVEGGEETESFYRVASKLMLSALPPMAAGVSADFFCCGVQNVQPIRLLGTCSGADVLHILWNVVRVHTLPQALF